MVRLEPAPSQYGLYQGLTGLNWSHRLLEQQLGAWRVTVQSDQGILEDRCSEMEVTMATMRQHNERLQDMLNQVAVTSSWGTGASWEL